MAPRRDSSRACDSAPVSQPWPRPRLRARQQNEGSEIMKIFIAGATGAVGKRLVPLLGANGHEVVGTTRSEAKVGDLRALGAKPVVLDVLDAEAVGRAVLEARPEVVVHQATALSGLGNLRNLDASFAETNRLRTEGTDNLLAAAR